MSARGLFGVSSSNDVIGLLTLQAPRFRNAELTLSDLDHRVLKQIHAPFGVLLFQEREGQKTLKSEAIARTAVGKYSGIYLLF